MVAGLLDVSDPMQAAQDLQTQMQQQALAQGRPAAVSPTAFAAAAPTQQGQQLAASGHMTPQSINELYGILAAGADDPAAIGQSYVKAMQTQQGLDFRQQPMQQWLELYGNINPYDFEVESLAQFDETLRATGDIAQAFRKLVRRNPLSSNEEQFLNDAITEANIAESQVGTALNLAQRFERGGLQGMKGGTIANISGFIRGVMGEQTDVDALRLELNDFVNQVMLQRLPPGVASDTDIRIAQRGFPDAYAKPEYIAAYLRGVAKLQAVNSARKAYEARYIGRKRSQIGMLDSWRNVGDAETLKMFDCYGINVNVIRDADGNPLTSDGAYRYYGGTGAIPGSGGPAVASDVPELLRRPENGGAGQTNTRDLVNQWLR